MSSPFDRSKLKFAEEIETFLEKFKANRTFNIEVDSSSLQIEGSGLLVKKPHANSFRAKAGVDDQFTAVEFHILGDQESPQAVGWQLHHGYLGSIPQSESISGLRVRAGNIQVGTNQSLSNVFPETRFNGWAVAEFHVLDSRIIPTGRRDYFEQNLPFLEMVDRLHNLGDNVARLSRSSSVERNRKREIELKFEKAESIVQHLRGASKVSKVKHAELLATLDEIVSWLEPRRKKAKANGRGNDS